MANHSYIGLYSGCGGADSGFVRHGFQSLGGFDINPIALDVNSLNLKGPTYQIDLKTDHIFDLVPENVDVVFSGAPCQGFSTAGNRIVDDPRNSLLVRGGEIALRLGARVFISENVMGSLSGKHAKYWQELEDLYVRNGYNTQFINVNCLDIGMAQMRKRVLFFAWLGSPSELKFPEPKRAKTLREVLANIEKVEDHLSMRFGASETDSIIGAAIKPRQKLSNVRGGNRSVATWDIPHVFGSVSKQEEKLLETLRTVRRTRRVRDYGDADPVPLAVLQDQFGAETECLLDQLIEKGYTRRLKGDLFDLTQTFNGKYRRLDWDCPSPTVDTRFGDPKYFLHPQENRGFSVREAARIQGFDDNFEFKGGLREQFRMIGNAVPPPLAEIVAKMVKEQLLTNE